jgi:AP-1 complex subunit beta-1
MFTGDYYQVTRRLPRYVYALYLMIPSNGMQNIVLSDKPPITTTIRSLPPQLLETLLAELSTLASVYHKPPEAFLGQGRFGAEAMQRAAIEEQEQEARENPIAAAAAAAAVSGKAAPTTNMENLLDIDFDGSAPASMQKAPMQGENGLEGLAGTPQRVASPGAPAQPPSNMDDLMGLFGDGGGGGGGAPPAGAQMSNDDIMNGFADMSIQSNQPPPPQQQMGGEPSKKSNQDLLDLF